MQWLNINIEILKSPEFMMSDPVARATWLCVIGYCVMQENDGCIKGGEAWGDRMWQGTCGVTLEEVRLSKRLIGLRSGSVYPLFYPHDKQAEVQAKREGGKKGGKKSGESRRGEGGSSASSSASPPAPEDDQETPSSTTLSIVSQPALNRREGNGIEENGREGNNRKKDNSSKTSPAPAPDIKYYDLISFGCVVGFDETQEATAVSIIEKFSQNYLYGLICKIRKQNKRKGKKARAWFSALLDEIQENPPQSQDMLRAN